MKRLHPTVLDAKMAYTVLSQPTKDYAWKEAVANELDPVYLLKHDPWVLLSYALSRQKIELEVIQEKLKTQGSQLSLL